MRDVIKYIALLLAMLIPAIATSHDLEVDGIYYNLNGNDATVVIGSFPYSGHLVIPDTVTYDGTDYRVTAIGHSAFRDCSDLKSVTIPRTVAAIGEHAFSGCTALDSVDICDLTEWCSISFSSADSNPCYHAHRLFLNGQEITELTIPDSATMISTFSFYGCTAINSVSVPKTVTAIGALSFSNSSSISTISVAGDNPVYDSRDSCNAIIETASNILISGCKRTIIPNTVTNIGN